MDPTTSEFEAQCFARQADQMLAQLRARLAPEDYRLVRQLRHLDDLATVAACAEAEERFLHALVAHFPAHALALQGVLAHVRATDADCDTLRGFPTGRQGG